MDIIAEELRALHTLTLRETSFNKDGVIDVNRFPKVEMFSAGMKTIPAKMRRIVIYTFAFLIPHGNIKSSLRQYLLDYCWIQPAPFGRGFFYACKFN